MKAPDRPDAERIIAPLKPFQRRTVDHAFRRLFEASDSSSRFLVADEVGLGKTLVARGIIARAIEHLWDTTDRIDIIYICSNASIARSNLPKLQIGGSESRSLPATRLTMLATQLAENDKQLRDSKLNFVSFTPSTSFKLGNSTGQSRERILLFYLLKDHVGSARHTGLRNLLQGTIRRSDRWREMIQESKCMPLDQSIRADFSEKFDGVDWRHLLEDVIDRWFRRYRPKGLPQQAREERNCLIGRLRQLLAECCLSALEPDLVIMDEFQRFKKLLDVEEGGPAAELAQALVKYETPEGSPVRTLLLSATPYKLYTTDAEKGSEGDHYEDFVATTRFLLDDDGRLGGLERNISEFRSALRKATHDIGNDDMNNIKVTQAKEEVEKLLCKVMARTERVVATVDRDAMMKEHSNALTLGVAEVRQYLAADDLFRAVGERDPIRYWKSAPYLAHFMRGYKFDGKLPESVELSPEEVTRAIKRHEDAYLRSSKLGRWAEVDAGNAKLREEMSRLLDAGLWRLLWMPPTIPYWPLEGPFAGQEGATKTLLFSAWNVVPDVVSAVLSFEAERRMVQGSDGRHSRIRAYKDLNKQQGQRLTLDAKGGEGGSGRTRHRLLQLLVPCLPLADIHPLSAPAGADRRDWVAEQVNDLLRDLPNPRSGQVDRRWEWVGPLLLDDGLRDFLAEWRDDPNLPPSTDHFAGYVDDLLDLDVSTLGRRPDWLPKLLADVALGSPAVVAARMLREGGITEGNRRCSAVRIADAFWHLFNRPAVIALLDQLYGAVGEYQSEVEGGYWRIVLRYSQDGNLQAVLDEQWHLLREQSKWEENSADEAVTECSSRLVEAILPKPSRVHARLFDDFLDGKDEPALDVLRVRTIFALRFGETEIEAEDGRPVSQDVVRSAFNSPFRPFVLASTSVGQEGLDFHPWCRRIVHWDLPGNPVDLEQREGRVHRYKCHAVRANVAAKWADLALKQWQLGDDLWQLVFDLADKAARKAGEHDLVPFWLCPGKHHVERHVPQLSYSREVEEFQRLKRQLAAYRVVFGQPRQEELVALLDRADLDLARLRDWAIDLSPPSVRAGSCRSSCDTQMTRKEHRTPNLR